jgi:hypothetical protein
LHALIKTAKHGPETREQYGFYRQAARGKHGAQMGVREARLRAEWAYLYPGLAPGEWMAASELVPLVLRHRLQDEHGWEFARRILADEHFEFRGGRPRDGSWTGVLSRVEDA